MLSSSALSLLRARVSRHRTILDAWGNSFRVTGTRYAAELYIESKVEVKVEEAHSDVNPEKRFHDP